MVTQHNSAVWPVPYTCAQPLHLGSGSHGQSAVSSLLGLISMEVAAMDSQPFRPC